jgi:hypothetical protein
MLKAKHHTTASTDVDHKLPELLLLLLLVLLVLLLA